MTVNTTTNRVSYAGNGTTTAFAVPFPFLADADLVVIERTDSTGAEVTKTLTTHYTVSGAGGVSGTVTMVTAPATGVTLIIYRDPAVTQLVDLVPNDPLPVETAVEQPLDRLTMIAQRNRDLVERALRLPDSDTGFAAGDMKIPAKVTRASKYLAFDADGKPMASVGTGADTGLRGDLAGTTGSNGAKLVGLVDSADNFAKSNVEDALAEIATAVMSAATVSSSKATVTDDTKYNAWPSVAYIGSNKMLMVYTKGDSHHLDNTGKVVGRISSDEGATWGAEFTVYDNATRWTTPMGVFRTNTGRVIVSLWHDDALTDNTGRAGVVYSDDNGATWSDVIDLHTPSGFTQASYASGPPIQLTNGDLLVTVEGNETGDPATNISSKVVKSTDNGATWGSPVVVASYATAGLPSYEPHLLLLPTGTILCLHRTSDGPGLHYINQSTDNGATWSARVPIFAGHARPTAIRLTSGLLVATTRHNADRSAVIFTSADNGVTWKGPMLVDAGLYEMMYMGLVQRADGKLLLVYGAQPTTALTNADIKTAVLQEDNVTRLSPRVPLRGYLAGLTLSNNTVDATNDIDVAEGEATDTSNTHVIRLTAPITKRLDAAWAVGSGSGGLDTGVVADGSYHVWLIRRSDTGVVDVLFSVSATGPVMPANYDQKRRIGAFIRSGGAILAFKQTGDYFRLVTAVLDVNVTNPGSAGVLRTLSVPSGVKVKALYNINSWNAAIVEQTYMSDPDATDAAVQGVNAPLASLQAAANQNGYAQLETMTNTSAQIRSRHNVGDANTTFKLATLGWTDYRGRND